MKPIARIVIVGLVLAAVAGVIVARKTQKAAEPQPTAATTATNLPRLLELGADKCIPCKMMAPILEEVSKEYKSTLKVEFVDLRKDRGAAEKYRVQVMPTQIIYDAQGRELGRHQGYLSKEDLVKKLAESGIKPGK